MVGANSCCHCEGMSVPVAISKISIEIASLRSQRQNNQMGTIPSRVLVDTAGENSLVLILNQQLDKRNVSGSVARVVGFKEGG